MKTTTSFVTRATVVLAAATLGSIAYANATAEADSAKDAVDVTPEVVKLSETNHIVVGGDVASISGNKAAYQARTGYNADGNGGIQCFTMGDKVTQDINYKVDGHAIWGNSDYYAHLKLAKKEFGYVDAGYSSFRTYYDGVGGFFPGNNFWTPLADQSLYVDRSKTWVEAVYNMPDKPEIRIKFTDERRKGNKESTEWGDTNLTGLSTTPSGNADRKVTGTYLNLNERHQTLEASAKHTIGKTTAELNVGTEWIDNFDTRYMDQYPGESTVNKNPNNETQLTQGEGTDQTVFHIRGTTRTAITEKITLLAGLGYEHTDSNLSGYRASYVVPTNLLSYTYKDLAGNAKSTVYSANVGVEFEPLPKLFVQTAFKYEDEYVASQAGYTQVSATTTATTSKLYFESGRNKEKAKTPEINVRYNGFNRVVLFGGASYRSVDADERNVTNYSAVVVPNSSFVYNNAGEGHTNANLGANYNVTQQLTLRAEVFEKNHTNRFIGYSNSAGSYYVLGYHFTGYKLSAIVKPNNIVSFTTRYQPQVGRMYLTRGTLTENQSLDATMHMVTEVIDLTPCDQLYAQLNVSVVYDSSSTGYPEVGGTGATKIRNADNNYWTTSATAGYRFTKATSLEAQGSYYRANNWDPTIASSTLMYGAGQEESSASLELKHKFTTQIQASAKIGYLKSRNDTLGNNTDFTARVAYLSVVYAF